MVYIYIFTILSIEAGGGAEEMRTIYDDIPPEDESSRLQSISVCTCPIGIRLTTRTVLNSIFFLYFPSVLYI